jgi:hypothetical protein
MSKDQIQMVSGIIGSMPWDLGCLEANKLQQKFISKDQNQMVSGIKGRLSWDLGKSFCQQTPAEVHEQGPEPDGELD